MEKWIFRSIEPQPARGALHERMWNDPTWIAEEKYDGERRIAQFCGPVVRFTGRPSRTTGKVVEKTQQLPHLSVGLGGERAHPPPRAMEGTVLDGELVLPANFPAPMGGKSKVVTSIANSLPQEAIRKQIAGGWLRYVVFDCLFFKGKDLREESLRERRKYVEQAVIEWDNPSVGAATVAEGNKLGYYDAILDSGGEGVILKSVFHTYGDKRLWVKVKRQATADVVIMGYKEAKAESRKVSGEVSATKFAREGLIGAVLCGQYKDGRLVEVAAVSGMPDDVRRELSRHPDTYLGRVLRIEFNEREPTGRFRHPRWDGLRTDKHAKSCLFDLDEK